MKLNYCGSVRGHLENSELNLMGGAGFFQLLVFHFKEKEIQVLFSFSQVSWDSMKEKSHSTTASYI